MDELDEEYNNKDIYKNEIKLNISKSVRIIEDSFKNLKKWKNLLGIVKITEKRKSKSLTENKKKICIYKIQWTRENINSKTFKFILKNNHSD